MDWLLRLRCRMARQELSLTHGPPEIYLAQRSLVLNSASDKHFTLIYQPFEADFSDLRSSYSLTAPVDRMNQITRLTMRQPTTRLGLFGKHIRAASTWSHVPQGPPVRSLLTDLMPIHS